MKYLLALAVAAAALGSAPASALPMASPEVGGSAPIVQVDFWCGPGYHIGRGGRRCWPNGWAPPEEVPVGFAVPPRAPAYLYNPPPVLECPPGFHLGRGLRRCWPD